MPAPVNFNATDAAHYGPGEHTVFVLRRSNQKRAKVAWPPWFDPREAMSAQVAVWGPPDLAIRYLEHERRIALSRDGNTMKGLVHAIQLASLTKLFGPRARSADAYCGLGQATFRAEVCAASDCVLTARGQRAIVRNSTDELLALPSLI
jgi:hypothetical protein